MTDNNPNAALCNHADNPKDAVYCARCGARIGSTNCQCGARVPAGADFCQVCGRSLAITHAPDMGRRGATRRDDGIRWVRDDKEVATRITAADLKGIFSNGLEVQHGTRALFFIGGRYVATLPPGRHTLESFLQKIKVSTEGEPVAIVVDDGELGLEFSIDGFHSSDHHNVIVHVEAAVRLSEPEVFLANLFRDQSTWKVSELTAFMAEEIRQSLRSLISSEAAEALSGDRARSRLEMELLSKWRATLEHSGFVLNRFRVLQFEIPSLEKAEDIRSETGDTVSVLDAGREQRGAYFDSSLRDLKLVTEQMREAGEAEGELRKVEIDVEIETMRREVDRHDKRNPVLERLLQGGNLNRMIELRGEEDWRKFQLQVDKDRLLSEQEWQELRRDVESSSAQAEVKREFVFKRLRAMAQAELDELAMKRAYQLKLLEMKGDTDIVEEQVRRERLQLDSEVANRRKAFEQQLEERSKWFDLEANQQRSAAELRMWQLERMNELDQLAEDRKAARSLQEKIALAEAARKEAEISSTMTAEQILAEAVRRSPDKAKEIAEAFRAMKSGEANDREKALYERMLGEVKASNERAQRLDHEKFIHTLDARAIEERKREVLSEQEKDRAERISTAGLTADDKKRAPLKWCGIHEIRYDATRICPMCERERGSGV